MTDRAEHVAHVDRWFATHVEGLGRDDARALFDRALVAVVSGSYVMLGEITVDAVIERVLFLAQGQFPRAVFERRGAALRTGPGVDPVAVRFVLVEFLSILGSLTSGLTTEPLHADLDRSVTSAKGAPPPEGADGGGSP